VPRAYARRGERFKLGDSDSLPSVAKGISHAGRETGGAGRALR